MIIRLLDFIIQIYIILVLVYSVGSWFPQFTQNEFFGFLEKIVEPPLELIRRVVPPMAGLDFSPAILIFLLIIIQHFLR